MGESALKSYLIEDDRRAERHEVSMAAKGILSNLDESLDCEIINLSETGAKLRLSHSGDLPEKLKLFVPETHSFNKCRIVWQENDEIGVRFETKLKLK